MNPSINKIEFPEKCNYELLYFKSQICERQLNYDEALNNINSILRCKNFVIPEFYKQKAEILLKQGVKYDSTEYYLSKAIELDSTYYDAYIDKFYSIIRISEFGALVEVDSDNRLSMEYPFSINGYFNSRKPEIEKNKLIKAESWFHFTRIKMMKEIKPTDFQTASAMNYVVKKHESIRLLQMAGDLLQIQQNFQEAVNMYNSGLKLCDKNNNKFRFVKHQILVSKAVCLYHLKNEPAMINAVNEALEINPNSFSRVLVEKNMEFQLEE